MIGNFPVPHIHQSSGDKPPREHRILQVSSHEHEHERCSLWQPQVIGSSNGTNQKKGTIENITQSLYQLPFTSNVPFPTKTVIVLKKEENKH